jgi:hypothetical protein
MDTFIHDSARPECNSKQKRHAAGQFTIMNTRFDSHSPTEVQNAHNFLHIETIQNGKIRWVRMLDPFFDVGFDDTILKFQSKQKTARVIINLPH